MIDRIDVHSPVYVAMLAAHVLLTLIVRLPAAAATRLQTVDPSPLDEWTLYRTLSACDVIV